MFGGAETASWPFRSGRHRIGEPGERRVEVLPIVDEHEMVVGHRGAERPADRTRFRVEVVERGHLLRRDL